ncbi:HSP-70 cofactor [Slackia heliotrinireducens]|uniref:Protein GrpE n=1 Tax=Slackia heliotrinireducens (strain ATCC 29202 / DSM 20476 / NCTC 11029 / RHS 1) TaxID=471855 RepID=C7N0W3_SLAHD|nr:nucleotide exchange factor GrpE [Slackia heliotrinireducens]ACV21191.1 molecular chaperone GrpE (heat shock protein) [Slackia heliotrinireducens DSM 20476]VEG98626.1 HSP-70 cofactor [Slackia heliotrinireducens]
MAQDDEKKVASGAHEIPIDSADAEETANASSAPEEVEPETAEEVEAEVIEPEAEPEAAPEAAAEETAFADAVEAEALEGEEVPTLDELAQAKADAAAMRDRYLRLQADWDNFRKRTAEQNAEMRQRATERLMEDVLPVLDDFERAIAHASQNGETGLLDGVKAISTKLNEVLAKHGLEPIGEPGEPFDAIAHQAVATVPDDSVPDETVAQVYQKGYRMGGKVIRSAMVTITTGGPRREAEDDK